MGMVIGLLKGCCLKISTKVLLKTKPIYIFVRAKMYIWSDGYVTASLHGAWVFVTVSTTLLYQMHPQIIKSILQGDSCVGNISFNFQ
jgi:hypothetical protein